MALKQGSFSHTLQQVPVLRGNFRSRFAVDLPRPGCQRLFNYLNVVVIELKVLQNMCRHSGEVGKKKNKNATPSSIALNI